MECRGRRKLPRSLRCSKNCVKRYGFPMANAPHRTGNFPPFRSLPDPSVSPAEVGEQGWGLADLLLPTMVLRESALHHNIDLNARWCASWGDGQVSHIKTHKTPT